MFGGSRVAKNIVRGANHLSAAVASITPQPMRRWIDSRFNKDEVILANGAAFDLIRASVNLVIAGLLIIMGTSLKLPLSTTYVTFIVAMGTSLADRAWTRESAVYRITAVYVARLLQHTPRSDLVMLAEELPHLATILRG